MPRSGVRALVHAVLSRQIALRKPSCAQMPQRRRLRRWPRAAALPTTTKRLRRAQRRLRAPARNVTACSRGLTQLSEREGECRNASGEHDESERRDASRNQPEPSRSELPSQSEHPSLAERGANEPKRQDGERGQEPAGRTKLDERPLIADTSLPACVSGRDLSMPAVVGQYRVGRGHLAPR